LFFLTQVSFFALDFLKNEKMVLVAQIPQSSVFQGFTGKRKRTSSFFLKSFFVIAHRFCCVCNQQYVIDTQGYFS